MVNSNAFFLIDLEPQLCKREVLLLSSNHTILECSSQIPLIFKGCRNPIQRGSHIYECIPDFSNFQEDRTNRFIFNDREMLGILYKLDYLSMPEYILEIYCGNSEVECIKPRSQNSQYGIVREKLKLLQKKTKEMIQILEAANMKKN